MNVEVQSSLETEKKYHKEVAITVASMTSCNDEAIKDLHQENESREKDWKAYEGKLFDLRKEVNETLDQTVKKVYNAFNQVADQ